MRMLGFTLAAALALSACSSIGGGKLAVCDGKHLRPANPYGTVLVLTPEGGAPAPLSGADEAGPKTLSSLGSPVSFGSCRA